MALFSFDPNSKVAMAVPYLRGPAVIDVSGTTVSGRIRNGPTCTVLVQRPFLPSVRRLNQLVPGFRCPVVPVAAPGRSTALSGVSGSAAPGHRVAAGVRAGAPGDLHVRIRRALLEAVRRASHRGRVVDALSVHGVEGPCCRGRREEGDHRRHDHGLTGKDERPPLTPRGRCRVLRHRRPDALLQAGRRSDRRERGEDGHRGNRGVHGLFQPVA